MGILLCQMETFWGCRAVDLGIWALLTTALPWLFPLGRMCRPVRARRGRVAADAGAGRGWLAPPRSPKTRTLADCVARGSPRTLTDVDGS